MLHKIDTTVVRLFQPLSDYFSWKTGLSNFRLTEILALAGLLPWLAVLYLRGARGWWLVAELILLSAGIFYLLYQSGQLESARARAFTGGRIINKWRNIYPYGVVRIAFVIVSGVFVGKLITGDTQDMLLMAACKALAAVLFASALCVIATKTLHTLPPPDS
ncbi:hypothetical protein HY414_01035 [Candidatus Kaiserbacteria bacterium]|nr:hypothetical protein [Candidatus Kaiserbacteria bacterium]